MPMPGVSQAGAPAWHGACPPRWRDRRTPAIVRLVASLDSHRHRHGSPRWRRLALLAGPFLLFATYIVPAPAGMAAAAWHCAGLAAWMALWWSTEAVPVPVTALLPLLVLPLAGVTPIDATAAAYAHPLIFLFLGGFLLALGIQKHQLHRRVALTIVDRLGTQPAALVGGFLAASGFLSMWVSNTATAMMMLPIALSVIATVRGGSTDAGGGEPGDRPSAEFATALLLAVAYGASIGGLGTLIGTPSNALLAAFAQEKYGIRIGFAQWMVVGVPLSLLLGLCAWLVLTRLAFALGGLQFATGRDAIRSQLSDLGPVGGNEMRVAAVFLATAVLWLFRPLLSRIDGLAGLSDPAIAVAAAMSLFLLPAAQGGGQRLLDWRDARELPWGTLILFGGGLSLAAAIGASGLADWIGRALALFAGWPGLALLLLVTAVVVFLTELTSNTATTATFLPLMGVLAVAAGLAPLALMAPVALAASAAFMLPVATPPNAIIFGSGRIAIIDMARTGLWLNLAAIGLVAVLAPVLLKLAFPA